MMFEAMAHQTLPQLFYEHRGPAQPIRPAMPYAAKTIDAFSRVAPPRQHACTGRIDANPDGIAQPSLGRPALVRDDRRDARWTT